MFATSRSRPVRLERSTVRFDGGPSANCRSKLGVHAVLGINTGFFFCYLQLPVTLVDLDLNISLLVPSRQLSLGLSK